MFEVCVPGAPELDWYKDGVLIEDEGRFVIEDAVEGEELYRLTVEDCEPEDSGRYTCLIKNDFGETQCSGKLVISEDRSDEAVGSPLNMTEVYASVDSAIQESEIEEKVSGDKLARQITPKGKVTPGTTSREQTVDTAREKIPEESKGGIEKKTTPEEPGDESLSKPEFLRIMKNSKVNEGESIVLEVEAEDEPLVDWYKDGNLLDDGGRIIIEDAVEGDTLYRLTIKDSIPDDSGHYKCVAVNDVGPTTCTAYIEVKKDDSLPEFIGGTAQSILNIRKGEDGRIDVEIRGRPDTKVSWFRNGFRLRSDRHVEIGREGNEHFIIVTKMMKSDSGVYKCVASSPGGTVSKEFQVNVEGGLNIFTTLFVKKK